MSSPWEDDQFDPAYWEDELWLEGDTELDLRSRRRKNTEAEEEDVADAA